MSNRSKRVRPEVSEEDGDIQRPQPKKNKHPLSQVDTSSILDIKVCETELYPRINSDNNIVNGFQLRMHLLIRSMMNRVDSDSPFPGTTVAAIA